MSLEFAQVHEFTETAKRASTVTDVADDFGRLICDLGFETYSFATLVDFELPRDSVLGFGRYPDEWNDRYAEKKYYKKDRVLELVISQDVPVVWNSEPVQTDLSKVQSLIFTEARDFGLRSGVTVPIHTPGKSVAAVSVAGEGPNIEPASIHAAHLMALYLHAAAVRLSNRKLCQLVDDRPLLSPREGECLRWVAAGKTNWEIGAILSISENTVHYHVEGAKRKLDASTRAHAVALAFYDDHIMP